jgi:hypothetical protein
MLHPGQLISTRKAAEVLGLPEREIYRLCKRKVISFPAARIDGYPVWSPADLAEAKVELEAYRNRPNKPGEWLADAANVATGVINAAEEFLPLEVVCKDILKIPRTTIHKYTKASAQPKYGARLRVAKGKNREAWVSAKDLAHWLVKMDEYIENKNSKRRPPSVGNQLGEREPKNNEQPAAETGASSLPTSR